MTYQAPARIYAIFIGVSGLLNISTLAHAENICTEILKYGALDVSNTFTDKQRFNLTKNAICKSEIHTFSEAQNSDAAFGLSIVSVLSTSFGNKVNESNFYTAKTEFCSSDLATNLASDKLISSTKRFSEAAAQAYTLCVSRTRGLIGTVTQAGNKESFSINLVYRPDEGAEANFFLKQLLVLPESVKCEPDYKKASVEHPIKIEGSKTIFCTNDMPQESVMVAIDTNVGPVKGSEGAHIELAGETETLGEIQARLTKIEGRLVPAGTIAYFRTQDCPTGWDRADELTGRYIVAVSSNNRDYVEKKVGEILSNLENRATGAHTHTYHQLQYNTPAFNLSIQYGSSPFTIDHNANTGDVAGGAKPGTNAPYVQLSACVRM